MKAARLRIIVSAYLVKSFFLKKTGKVRCLWPFQSCWEPEVAFDLIVLKIGVFSVSEKNPIYSKEIKGSSRWDRPHLLPHTLHNSLLGANNTILKVISKWPMLFMIHEGACRKVFCEMYFKYSLLLCSWIEETLPNRKN